MHYEQFLKTTPEKYRNILGEKGQWREPSKRELHLKELLKEPECNIFINLTLVAGELSGWPNSCKWNPRRITGFGTGEIKKVLWEDRDYEPYIGLLDDLRQDLAGNTTSSWMCLSVLREGDHFLPNYHLYPDLQESNDPRLWILFLNHDFRGGKLFFPTRRHLFDPKQGEAVLFPGKLPFGISPVRHGQMHIVVGDSAHGARSNGG